MAGSEGKQIRSPAASGLHQTHPAEAPAALQGRGGQVGQRGCVPSQALGDSRRAGSPGAPSSSAAAMAVTGLTQARDLLPNAAQAPGACCGEARWPRQEPEQQQHSRPGAGWDRALGVPGPTAGGLGCRRAEPPSLGRRKKGAFVGAVRGPAQHGRGRGHSINPHFVPAHTKSLYGGGSSQTWRTGLSASGGREAEVTG